MISYAASAEDVVLHRALCGNDSTRRYVDVGACSPDTGSVTRHFYEAGWSGIDIEPLAEEAAELRRARPRDIVVEAALGTAAGEATIHMLGDERGLSTMDAALAEGYLRDGHPVQEVLVEVRTLADVFDEHCEGEISFLKVDVEGAERAVILGNDWSRWRPRVVLVEATNPWSHVQSHSSWEPELLDAGYLFASFDGVNRFYARCEEPDLVELLAPASVLDNFVPENVDRVERYVHHLQAELDAHLAHVAELEVYIERLDAAIASKDGRIAELEARLVDPTAARDKSRRAR
jgi:FkbM family methyltransferase